MEQRQQQVQVGAGLQESRLNTDLINFLQKYGSWAVYALLVVVLAYVGNNWWKQQQEKKLDAAFADFRAALDSGNPASLVDVATGHPGSTVANMAKVSAAGMYVDLARKGLKPGANFAAPTPEDRLDEAGKRNMQAEATKLIDAVLANSDSNASLKQQARWFRATLQADSGDVAGAVKTMEEVAASAKAMGFTDQETKATQRIEHLKRLASIKPLLSRADLPESAREPEVVASAPGPTGVDGITPTIQGPPGLKLEKIDPEEVRKLMREGKIDPNPKDKIEINPPAPGTAPAPGAAPEGTAPAPATPPATPPANPPASEPKPN